MVAVSEDIEGLREVFDEHVSYADHDPPKGPVAMIVAVLAAVAGQRAIRAKGKRR